MAEQKKIETLNFREAQAKRKELLDECNVYYKEIGDETPPKEKMEEIAAKNKDIEICERIIEESKEFQEMKARHEQAYGQVNQPGAAPGVVPPPYGGNMGQVAKSVGEQFADQKEYQQWVESKSGGPDRVIGETVRVGDSPALPFNKKDLIIGGSVTSAGALVRTDFKPFVDLPFIKLMLRDIITNGQTGSDTVEYPQMVSRTNRAAVVPEATQTATSGDEDSVKPESAMVLKKVTANVKTIAHWLPATKRALSDAGQIRTLVDAFLLFGLDETVEDEVLNGSGTGDHLLGLANTPGLGGQDFVTDIFTTTRKARTKAELVGLVNPTAYLLSPYDWEKIELTKDGMDRYYYGGPQVLGNPRLWGLPVVTSVKQPAGAGYCGDFRQVVIWDREQSSIRVSDSHMDFFIRNMVAILAELRLANGVFRPEGIVEMDLFAGANS